MLYDALTYANQIEERKRNRKGQKIRREKVSSSEFLSGLKKGEQLSPVITLVIYYGKEPWDGPRNLADMLDMEQEGGVDMCQAIREMIEEGRAEGRREGIRGCINSLRELCCMDDVIIRCLIKQFDLNKEEAQSYLMANIGENTRL